MAGPHWLYLEKGKQRGPVPQEQLQLLLMSGKLAKDCLVWRQGLAAWTSAAHVPDLQQAVPPPVPDSAVPAQRAYLTACGNCRGLVLYTSHRDAKGRIFCSDTCLQWANAPYYFCQACIAATTDASAGNLTQVNGIGEMFIGSGDPCPTCRSVVRRVWLGFVFVPVIPLRRYRVIRNSPRTYYSRRLR